MICQAIINIKQWKSVNIGMRKYLKYVIGLFLLLPLTVGFPRFPDVLPNKAKNARKVSKKGLFSVIATVMTSRTGGRRLASGERNDANKSKFVALPCRSALGKMVGISIPSTNQEARNIPVRDVGPHSVSDPYWNKDGVPLAERGISDKYGRAKNKAGIDLSLKLAKDLGLQYPFKGEVTWWFEEDCEN